MSTIAEIMQALSDQLEDIIQPASPDVQIHFESEWFPIAETPSVDMRVANPTGLEDGLAGFGSHTRYGAFPLVLRVRVGMADGDAGQALLYEMIDNDGPLSIVAALDSDRTLGGVCDDLTWGTGFPWTGLEPYIDANGDGSLAGSELSIVIVTTQS